MTETGAAFVSTEHFFQLRKGAKYRIIHQSPTQRVERESVMVFLGMGGIDGKDAQFDARPLAGTQSLPPGWVKRVEEVHRSEPTKLNTRPHLIPRAPSEPLAGSAVPRRELLEAREALQAAEQRYRAAQQVEAQAREALSNAFTRTAEARAQLEKAEHRLQVLRGERES